MGCRQHNWISSTKASNEMFPLLIRLCDDKWGSFGCVSRAVGNVTPSSARYFTAMLVEFARNVGLSIANDGYSRLSAGHADDSGIRVKVSRFVETRHGLGPGDGAIMYLPRIAFGVRHIGSGFRDLLSSDFLKHSSHDFGEASVLPRAINASYIIQTVLSWPIRLAVNSIRFFFTQFFPIRNPRSLLEMTQSLRLINNSDQQGICLQKL